MKHEIPEVKSLRWLANNFSFTKNPKEDADKLSNAIHVYRKAGADKIEELQAKIDLLSDAVQYMKP